MDKNFAKLHKTSNHVMLVKAGCVPVRVNLEIT